MKKTVFIWKDHARSVLYIVFSLLAGLCLLFVPRLTTSLVFWGLAAVLLVMGAMQLIGYFRSDVQGAIAASGMALGLLMIILGLFVGFGQQTIVSFLPAIFGLVLFAGGVFKTQGAFDMKRMGDQRWVTVLIGACISAVLGLIVLINPFDTMMTLMRVMGAFLVVESAQDMLYAWRYEKIRKNFVIH